VIRFPRATAAELGARRAGRTAGGGRAAGHLAGRGPAAPETAAAGASLWNATARGCLFLLGLGVLLLLGPEPGVRSLGAVLLAGAVAAWIIARGTVARGTSRGMGRRTVYGRDGARAAGSWTVSAGRMAQIDAGIAGEELVLAALARELPGAAGGYVVLQNLSLPGVGGDVDHVVVGPTGLFVLETKHISGTIRHDAAGWSRLKPGGVSYEAIDDPLAQVRRNVRGVRQYLERRDAALCARTRLWIEEMIVFSHPKANVVPSARPDPVHELRTLVPAILGRRPALALGPAEVARLVELLKSGRAAAPAPAAVSAVSAVPGR
jgi:hypothetical protein